jgi:hypothetical protein
MLGGAAAGPRGRATGFCDSQLGSVRSLHGLTVGGASVAGTSVAGTSVAGVSAAGVSAGCASSTSSSASKGSASLAHVYVDETSKVEREIRARLRGRFIREGRTTRRTEELKAQAAKMLA